MKTKLLILMLCMSTLSFAQFPTSGLVGYYDFTNGSLLDQANGNNFTKTGTASINVNDRFVTASNAINLNEDYLTRPDIAISGTHTFTVSYSFWLKTAADNANLETIIDDSTRNTVTHFDSDDYGYYIYLQDGKIRLTSRFGTRLMWSNPIYDQGYGHASTKFVADDNWHHIVVEFKTYISSGIQYVTSKIYIDTVAESNSATHNGIVNSPNTTGNVTIANSRTNHLTSVNQYKDILDDIFVYNRSLTQAEVVQLATLNNYCLTPDAAIISTNSITNTSADINISNAGTYDIAYHKTNESFASGTIIAGVTSGIQNISGLEEFTSYEVYVREQCAASTTGWSNAVNFETIRTIGRIYVDLNATGNNNGVSWTDAYTDLKDALLNMEANEEIWVAQGTYIPDGSDRDLSFNITEIGTKLYGGFIGTETDLSQRDFRTNTTILSGDLSSNDDNTIEFSNATRDDNSYNIITVNNTAIIDGFTIANAHANGSSSEQQSGGAIFKGFTINSLDINNCIIKNNVSTTAAAAVYSRFDATGTLKIHNSEFNNNLSRYGTAIYSYTGNGFTADIEVANSLFYNNTAKNNGGTTGYAGSAGWFRAYGTGSTMNSTLINNTYYNNIDTGTASGLNNFNRATVGMGYIGGTLNGDVANNIFWGNTTTNGSVAKSIAQISTTLGQNITVNNSIGQDGFSTISGVNVTNSLSSDPLFTNPGNNDFTLQAASPGINAGNNSKIPSDISSDILGNTRVYESGVDMGPYEKTCTSTCYTLTINVIGNGSIENNGISLHTNSAFEQNAVLSLVPLAELGDQFAGWDGDASGNLNPLSLTMDADKTITAVFGDAPIYVDKDATGANNGGSWTDAFTSIESALAAATLDDPIWVADGVYYPSTTNGDPRKATYLIPNNIKIYGGFNGMETLITQRNPKSNITILSGDLSNNDTSTLLHTEPTRQDNAYHVVSIRGNSQDIIIDGFTISGGNANGSTNNSCSTAAVSQYYDTRGGAIYINPYATGNETKAMFKNCVLENNTGISVAVFSAFIPCGIAGVSHDIDFESCIIRNNYSNDLSAFLYSGSSGYTIYSKGSIVNSLFYNNTSNTNSGALYLGSSTANGGNTSGLDVEIINTTFSNNTGVNGSVITMIRASNSKIQNSIIYGNGSITPFNITTSGSVVSNSIIEGGQQSGMNLNPLFTDAVNHNYTLQAGSPALDVGHNGYVLPGTIIDLDGNSRIVNTTVDLGCYEYDPSLSIAIAPKVFLQGPLLNLGTAGLMNDNLRANGYIPTTSPYTDVLTCNVTVFTTTGNDAIVDWVFVELRDETDNTAILHSQSALLQRDGDVVATDGVSSLSFNTTSGNYYVAIKHRNHLSIMSANAVALSSSAAIVDFTNSASPITYGTNAQSSFGMQSGMLGMWAGNVGGDTSVRYQGSGNDTNSLKDAVLADIGNTTSSNLHSFTGYSKADVNLDGSSRYQGSGNDSNTVKDIMLAHPDNQSAPSNLFIILEQLPEN